MTIHPRHRPKTPTGLRPRLAVRVVRAVGAVLSSDRQGTEPGHEPRPVLDQGYPYPNEEAAVLGLAQFHPEDAPAARGARRRVSLKRLRAAVARRRRRSGL